MSESMEPAQRQVPTLTEVVSPGGRPAHSVPTRAPSVNAMLDAAELERRVLVEVQCRLAGDLEGSLRAAIEPLLGELTEALLRAAQAQVVDSLRAMVREAVAQELALREER